MKKTETTHTPGPWRATPYGETFSIDAPKGKRDSIGLASVNPRGNWDSGIPSAQDRANARLIAAAPDFEIALKRIAGKAGDALASGKFAIQTLDTIEEIATNALAKAKGG